MKHATSIALDGLEPVLANIRCVSALIERKRGTFYRGSSAFVHFHEDPAGFFADVKTASGWVRLPASSAIERRALLSEIKRWA